MSVRGRIWKFGDDVNTDLIIPGKYLDSYDPAHLAAHAMEGANKEFASVVKKGDMIVAGANFGCGSSREQAVMALKHAGVHAIVAKSFARIFYRNAINLGLPVVTSKDAVSSLRDGEIAVLDLTTSSLTTEDGRETVNFEPIPQHVKKILDSGGLVPYIKAKLRDR
jgi:3-isopropylmalate/(R)-2-methylmalate dehydratase small subunit